MAKRFDAMTRAELLELAGEREIAGRSRMNKDELIAALRGRRGRKSKVESRKLGAKKARPKKKKVAPERKPARKPAAKARAPKKTTAKRTRSPRSAAPGTPRTPAAGPPSPPGRGGQGVRSKRGRGAPPSQPAPQQGAGPGAFREVPADDHRAAEQAVHTAKFLVAVPEAKLPEHVNDLPYSYARDRLVLMVRDPHSLYCYWDFSPATYERIGADARPLVLRFRDVDERLEPLTFEVERQGGNKYYIHLAEAGTHYRAELCLVSSDGTLETVLVSDEAATPPDRPARHQSTVKGRFRVPGSWFPVAGSATASDLVAGFTWAYAASGATDHEVEGLAAGLDVGTHELAAPHAAISRMRRGQVPGSRFRVPGSRFPGSSDLAPKKPGTRNPEPGTDND